MPGKPIKDLCPWCGMDGGMFHDWFPELGDREEWPCGSVRGIDRHTGRRTTYTSKACEKIHDLQMEVKSLQEKVPKTGEVVVQKEYFDALESGDDVVKPYSVWLHDVFQDRKDAP